MTKVIVNTSQKAERVIHKPVKTVILHQIQLNFAKNGKSAK